MSEPSELAMEATEHCYRRALVVPAAQFDDHTMREIKAAASLLDGRITKFLKTRDERLAEFLKERLQPYLYMDCSLELPKQLAEFREQESKR